MAVGPYSFVKKNALGESEHIGHEIAIHMFQTVNLKLGKKINTYFDGFYLNHTIANTTFSYQSINKLKTLRG